MKTAKKQLLNNAFFYKTLALFGKSKGNARVSLNRSKYLFYIITILGVFSFFLSGLISRGQSYYNLFNPDKKDYFMDFFNVLYTLFNGPYTHSSIYPPLPLVMHRLMLRFIPFDIVEKGAIAIRASQAGQVVFLFYMLITLFLFFILITEIKKGPRIEKYIFTFIILFSAPFLHQFERTNTVFVALIFLMMFVFFKDSKNRVVREIALISLAVSTGIKLYPAIFILLLIKEKRFEDAIMTLMYLVAAVILPFFALGGISQLPLFIKNILFVSNEVLNWGVGYSINVQNTTRIFFGFLGNFGSGPIAIGRTISIGVLILGLVSVFFSQSKWKTVALLSMLMILIPPISFEYVLVFMIIPLIMFLDRSEKDKRMDYLYLACFVLIFMPFTLGKVSFINAGFGRNITFPLTYGVLFQNIAMSTMAIFLIIQGFMSEKPKTVLKPVKDVLLSFILKIFGTNKAGFKGFLVIAGKVLLTSLIILIIFGDSIFSTVYTYYNPPKVILSDFKRVKGQDYAYISSVEPYYVHYGDKVILVGKNFSRSINKHAIFMSNYGEIMPGFWTTEKFVFTVPLEWKLGRVVIWIEASSSDGTKLLSNKVEIKLIDRLGDFNNDDIKYFAQIKYLSKEAREINNFKNYKLRNYRLSRWIPTKAFQVYADSVELKNKIAEYTLLKFY